MTVIFMPESGRNRYDIYHLINTANELPFYVGYTSDLYGRYRVHLKKNPGTLEGAARFRLISALADAGFGFELVVHHSFRYRGDAMRRESAMIQGNASERGCNIELSSEGHLSKPEQTPCLSPKNKRSIQVAYDGSRGWCGPQTRSGEDSAP